MKSWWRPSSSLPLPDPAGSAMSDPGAGKEPAQSGPGCGRAAPRRGVRRGDRRRAHPRISSRGDTRQACIPRPRSLVRLALFLAVCRHGHRRRCRRGPGRRRRGPSGGVRFRLQGPGPVPSHERLRDRGREALIPDASRDCAACRRRCRGRRPSWSAVWTPACEDAGNWRPTVRASRPSWMGVAGGAGGAPAAPAGDPGGPGVAALVPGWKRWPPVWSSGTSRSSCTATSRWVMAMRARADSLRKPASPSPAAHPDLTIVFAHMGGGLFLYELMPEVRKSSPACTTTPPPCPICMVPRSTRWRSSCAGRRASSSSEATSRCCLQDGTGRGWVVWRPLPRRRYWATTREGCSACERPRRRQHGLGTRRRPRRRSQRRPAGAAGESGGRRHRPGGRSSAAQIAAGGPTGGVRPPGHPPSIAQGRAGSRLREEQARCHAGGYRAPVSGRSGGLRL